MGNLKETLQTISRLTSEHTVIGGVPRRAYCHQEQSLDCDIDIIFPKGINKTDKKILDACGESLSPIGGGLIGSIVRDQGQRLQIWGHSIYLPTDFFDPIELRIRDLDVKISTIKKPYLASLILPNLYGESSYRAKDIQSYRSLGGTRRYVNSNFYRDLQQFRQKILDSKKRRLPIYRLLMNAKNTFSLTQDNIPRSVRHRIAWLLSR